jgi:hypothetical protein
MAIFYTPLTDFLTKDTLPKEDPDKVILGADFSAEFNAISTAFAGAAPILDPNFNGTVTFVDATGGSLTVTGTLAGGSLAISGNGTINGNLDVGGAVTSDGSELATEDYVDGLIDDAALAVIGDAPSDGKTYGRENSAWAEVVIDTSEFDQIVQEIEDTLEEIENGTINSAELNVSGNAVIGGSTKSKSYIETHAVTTGVLDCSLANVFSATLSTATTFSFTNVPAVDGAYACTLKLASAGNAVTWPTGTVWSKATPPTLSAGTDVFVLLTMDAGTTWYGFVSGQEIA